MQDPNNNIDVIDREPNEHDETLESDDGRLHMEIEDPSSESVENEEQVDAPMQDTMRPIIRNAGTGVNRLEMRFDGKKHTHTPIIENS